MRNVQLKGRPTSVPQELGDLEDCTVTSEDVMSEEEEVSNAKAIHKGLVELPKEVRNLVAGGFAGMLAKSVVAPLDRVKILFQVSSCKFRLRNVPNVMRTIAQDEGVGALWKGNTATMIRVFPYSGIQFMVFDRCKTHFLRQHDASTKWGLSPLESLISGMIAGTVSVLATYPLDLTRAQLAVLRKHRDGVNRGFVNVIIDTYTHRGMAGLFRGVVPTMVGILPYSGIAFALNEQGKREVCPLCRSHCNIFV